MTIYEFGPFRLNEERLLLLLGGEPVAVGPKVVETILALVKQPGEVLSKTELLDRVWPEGFVEEANLAQNIYVIRKTLRAHWDVEAIATVPRRGYRFIAPVRFAEVAPARPEPLNRPSEFATPAGPVVRPRAAVPARLAYAFAAFVLLVVGATALSFAVKDRVSTVATRHLSPEGSRLYALGRFYWNQRTQSGVEKSLRYFSQVTGTDPADARGYAALAEAFAIMGDYGYGRRSAASWYRLAVTAAKNALARDSQSAEAHAAMGIAEDRPGSRARAQSEYRRAIALDPSYGASHQWYGISLLMQGRGEQAYSELQRAASLEPLSVATTDWLAEAAYFSRRYPQAIEYARETLDLAPQRVDAYQVLGLSYEAQGKYDEALSSYRTYGRQCSHCRLEAAPLIAHTEALEMRFDEARAQLRVAQTGLAAKIVAPDDIVMALVAMGQRNDALRLLRHADRKRLSPIIALDPRMDPVRGDRRFRLWVKGPA